VDLNGDGDHKLLVGDMDKKLKVYKGTALISEHALLDVPVSICIFYPDVQAPRTPAVAAAAGSYVFIYRYPLSLPPSPPHGSLHHMLDTCAHTMRAETFGPTLSSLCHHLRSMRCALALQRSDEALS
jgi:hypothetical protein